MLVTVVFTGVARAAQSHRSIHHNRFCTFCKKLLSSNLLKIFGAIVCYFYVKAGRLPASYYIVFIVIRILVEKK